MFGIRTPKDRAGTVQPSKTTRKSTDRVDSKLPGRTSLDKKVAPTTGQDKAATPWVDPRPDLPRAGSKWRLSISPPKPIPQKPKTSTISATSRLMNETRSKPPPQTNPVKLPSTDLVKDTPEPERSPEPPKVSIDCSPHRFSRQSIEMTRDKSRLEAADELVDLSAIATTNSKNLKREYKKMIADAVSGLYELLEASEAELRALRVVRMGEGITAGAGPATKDVVPAPAVAPDPLLSQKLEEHTRLLLDNGQRIRALQDLISKQQEETVVARQTCAGVVVAASPPRRPAVSHSLIVSSSDETKTSEEVLNQLREAVEAKEGWVKVDRVRKAKDRKVVMAFSTKEEREKARVKVEERGSGLLVEEVSNRDPLLVLRGVASDNTDDDVVKALRNQNRELFDDLDQETNRVRVRYRKRTRNPHVGHVVLETSPTLWNRIIRKGYIHIDLQRVRAEDQSPLVQCARCLGYGHSKRFCTESVDVCSHCGGPHLRTECTDWAASVPPSCRNCRKAKLDDLKHNAFDSNCPVRKRWDDLARSTVAYS